MRTMPRVAYPVDEAWRVAGFGRTALYDAIRAGELEAMKHGRKKIIRASELNRWIEGLTVIEPNPRMKIQKPLLKTELIQRFESILANLVEDLLIARPPAEADQRKAYFNGLKGHRSKVTNQILAAITSTDVTFRFSGPSQLNGSTEHFFDDCENWTSVKLFSDDVVRLLRQLYGDIDPNLLWYISQSIDSIVVEDDLEVEDDYEYMDEDEDEDLYWRVHSDATTIGLGAHRVVQRLPAVSENVQIVILSPDAAQAFERDKMFDAAQAIERNNMFARKVLDNPSNFSKYTVRFATIWQSTNPPDIKL